MINRHLLQQKVLEDNFTSQKCHKKQDLLRKQQTSHRFRLQDLPTNNIRIDSIQQAFLTCSSQPEQQILSSSCTMAIHQTAVTQYINANGNTLAYRRLGPTTGIPLVVLMHFRGNIDFWDPSLINALSLSRPLILLDNAGTGKSSGQILTTFHGWALNGGGVRDLPATQRLCHRGRFQRVLAKLLLQPHTLRASRRQCSLGTDQGPLRPLSSSLRRAGKKAD